MQRDLMQFFKPENYFTVHEALIQAQPPREAIEARRRRANEGDHYHTVANPAKGEKPGSGELGVRSRRTIVRAARRPAGRTGTRSTRARLGPPALVAF